MGIRETPAGGGGMGGTYNFGYNDFAICKLLKTSSRKMEKYEIFGRRTEGVFGGGSLRPAKRDCAKAFGRAEEI